jgi:hypothetical protein
MEENLISLETAKLAKEKGFDWRTRSGYHSDLQDNELWEGWDLYLSDDYEKRIVSQGVYSAPTQSHLEDWLFIKHSINIELTFDDGTWFIYVGEFSFPDNSLELVGHIECDGFESAKREKVDAKEIGLQEALKLVE